MLFLITCFVRTRGKQGYRLALQFWSVFRCDIVCSISSGNLNNEVSTMTAAGFRKIALSLPEAVEGSHFGNADFRVRGKIFATLSLQSEGYGVLLLSPKQQAAWSRTHPKFFLPFPEAGGKRVRRGYFWQRYQRTYLRPRCGRHGCGRRRSESCRPKSRL
jgi:YjbR